MLILNNEPKNVLDRQIVNLPIDRDDTYLLDARGSMRTLINESGYREFTRLFGQDISLNHFIREDWRFRIKQKTAASSIYLTYFHPKLRLSFRFKIPKDWRQISTLREIFVCGTSESWFDGCFATNLSPFPPINTAVYVEKTLNDFTDSQLIDELHSRKVTKKKKIKTSLEKAA